MQQSAMIVIRMLSSLKLTLAGMLVLAAGVLIGYRDEGASVLWLAAPLLVLALNLLCALVCNPRFRRQGGLIVFHLCLLGVMVLGAAGRLASFKGRVEISEEQWFDPASVEIAQRGPWHPQHRMQAVSLRQGAIRVDYAPGLRRGTTVSEVHDGDGTQFTVGDTRPFRSAGYRFYTTSNKGYAVILGWNGDAGEELHGAVHFPSYPFYEWKQTNRWVTPGGTAIDLEFHPLARSLVEGHWVLDSAETGGALSVILDGQIRHTLQAGDSLRLAGGVLQYDGPRMWMGYEVYYDPVLPWLFAASLVGVLGLSWHYVIKIGPLPAARRQRKSARGACLADR